MGKISDFIAGKFPTQTQDDAQRLALLANTVRGAGQSGDFKGRMVGGFYLPGQNTSIITDPVADLAASRGQTAGRNAEASAIARLATPNATPQAVGEGIAGLPDHLAQIAMQHQFPHVGQGGATAKFSTMHQSGRMSVNIGGQQRYADGPQEPVDFRQDRPLMQQVPVTDSAGNTQLVWQKVPFGEPAPPAAPAGAPGAPPTQGPMPPPTQGPMPNVPAGPPPPRQPMPAPAAPNAPMTTLSTGPQAAAHAGDVAKATDDSKTYAQRNADLPKAKNLTRLAVMKSNQLASRIDDIAGDPNLQKYVGLEPGRLLAQIPGNEMADLRLKITALKQAISLESLNEMRQSSPTGGALGQITEGEYPILASDISALNENMTVGEFMKQMAQLKRRSIYAGMATERKFNDEYGADFKGRYPGVDTALQMDNEPNQLSTPLPPAPPPQAKTPRSVDDLLKQYSGR